MTTTTLGTRYLNVCKVLGVSSWQAGILPKYGTDRVDYGDVNGCVNVIDEYKFPSIAKREGWELDLSDAATTAAALLVYDSLRTRTAHDPVYAAAATYGLASPETREALVGALERLVTERAGGGAP
jgi:hypothetical protein